jgi:hypothetical protein
VCVCVCVFVLTIFRDLWCAHWSCSYLLVLLVSFSVVEFVYGALSGFLKNGFHLIPRAYMKIPVRNAENNKLQYYLIFF